MLSKNIWIVESVFTLSNVDELLNGTVIVNVSNEFGFQTLNYEVVNGIFDKKNIQTMNYIEYFLFR